MEPRLFSTLLFLTFLQNALFLKELMKPSFVPYCMTRKKCQPICVCDVQPECKVLELDNSSRDSISYYHNQIRNIQSKAEPQPAGMTMVKYDQQLEEISKCWAARCEDEYSECFITSIYSETSMLVSQIKVEGRKTPSVILWIEVIESWLGKNNNLSAETLSSLPAGEKGENLRNYAQVLSDQVSSIGCAWSQKSDIVTCVCTYGPRGPLQGEPIYKAGEPCSSCPINYACDNQKPFDYLCKEVVRTTVAPPETPPRPPYTPPTKKHKTLRSHHLIPPLKYQRYGIESQSIDENEPMEIEYESQAPVFESMEEFDAKQDYEVENIQPRPYAKEEIFAPIDYPEENDIADLRRESNSQILPLIPSTESYGDAPPPYPVLPKPPDASLLPPQQPQQNFPQEPRLSGKNSNGLETSAKEPIKSQDADDSEELDRNTLLEKARRRSKEFHLNRSSTSIKSSGNLVSYILVCVVYLIHGRNMVQL